MQKPARMLRELIGSLCRDPVTVRYPYERLKMPPMYRGRIAFQNDLCVGCKICMRDCPSKAIEIIALPVEKYQFTYQSLLEAKKVSVQVDRGGKKRFNAVINLGKCLFCAQCVESCPRKALFLTDDYELATLDKDRLLRTYEEDPRLAKKT